MRGRREKVEKNSSLYRVFSPLCSGKAIGPFIVFEHKIALSLGPTGGRDSS
jgi:hypothetical protein